MNKILLATIMLTGITSTLSAQQKLNETEMKAMAHTIETDWRFGTSHVIWLENQNSLSGFLSTAGDRCLDDLTFVVELAEVTHGENQRILQMEKQIYPKPGSKKSEQSLLKYFSNPEKAKQKFAAAKEAEQMYERLVKETAPIIAMKQRQKFTIPQGELTYFYFRQGGGMVHRPALESTLKRQDDGTYTVQLDTEEFHKLDTLSVTQAQVDTVRQMLIEGEVYKMPRYHDEPMMIFDAPHSSVAVRFTDASYSCNNFPPNNWGGKNIWAIYRYLKSLQKK